MKIGAVLDRTYNKTSTLGDLVFVNDHDYVVGRFKTLELPWRNNNFQISCIPEGEYKVIPRWSEKFKNHFHILDVPNRTYILFHVANYTRELMGCVAVGMRFGDIDGDGIVDVLDSRLAMNSMLNIAPEGFTLKIGSELSTLFPYLQFPYR